MNIEIIKTQFGSSLKELMIIVLPEFKGVHEIVIILRIT